METIKIKTPSGKEAELKSYLTARERRQIRGVYISAIKPEMGTDGKPIMSGVSGEMMEKAEEMLIRIAVVSYNGSSENILERLLDGQDNAEDYEFLVNEANKISKGNFQTAK